MPFGHNKHVRAKKVKRTQHPKIYFNVSNTLKTVTFKSMFPCITSKQLRAFKDANAYPNKFSASLYMKDVISILIHNPNTVYVDKRVAKYLITYKRFMNELNRSISRANKNIEYYTGKKCRATSESSVKMWTRKIEEERDFYDKNTLFRDNLINITKNI